jgi:hypothetical protein
MENLLNRVLDSNFYIESIPETVFLRKREGKNNNFSMLIYIVEVESFLQLWWATTYRSVLPFPDNLDPLIPS